MSKEVVLQSFIVSKDACILDTIIQQVHKIALKQEAHYSFAVF